MSRAELIRLQRGFLTSVRALKRLAKDPRQRNPIVFVAASAFIEYLSKLFYGRGGPTEYKKFVRLHLSKANSRYRTFAYRFADGSMRRDLPLQLYHVLRCGIIHSYSLVPDDVALQKGGRDRSVVLAHRASGLVHLSQWFHDDQPTCVLVAEDFVADIEATVRYMFRRAQVSKALAKRMGRWMKKHPPIQGGILLTSRR
jgi:hypothetical protein